MSHYAPHMTREALDNIASDNGVGILPTGSLEQHGPHLPVGTDSMLAEAVTREAVSHSVACGTEAVAFPAIWTGFSPHHVALGGTISVQKETLLALLEDICQSMMDIGFQKILLVNGHGGNRPIASLAVRDLGTSQHTTDIGELTYLSLAQDIIDDVRRGETGSAYHAGEVETSLMLHLYPDLVDMSVARDSVELPLTSYSGKDMFQGGPLNMRRTYDRLTDHGVRGEPTKATAAAGETLFDAISEELASLIEEFAQLEQ